MGRRRRRHATSGGQEPAARGGRIVARGMEILAPALSDFIGGELQCRQTK